jgi:hypothetical protein
MTTKAMLLVGAGACWLLTLLALAHCLADAVARRRSAKYRALAEEWDAAGPLWRYWVLAGSWLAGTALIVPVVIR